MNYNCYGRPPVRPGGSPNIGAGQMMRGMPNGMNNEQMKQAIMARNYMARGMPFAGIFISFIFIIFRLIPCSRTKF